MPGPAAPASSWRFQSVRSAPRSPPVGATKPPKATAKIAPAYACAGTPRGVRDHGPRPLRVKMLSPLVHPHRGQAAASEMAVPLGLRHGAKPPLVVLTRLRRKASIIEAPPP